MWGSMLSGDDWEDEEVSEYTLANASLSLAQPKSPGRYLVKPEVVFLGYSVVQLKRSRAAMCVVFCTFVIVVVVVKSDKY